MARDPAVTPFDSRPPVAASSRATLAGTTAGETRVMDNLGRAPGNANLAQILIDCPWCSEPQRATADEIDAGFTCEACLTRIEVAAARPLVIAVPELAAA